MIIFYFATTERVGGAVGSRVTFTNRSELGYEHHRLVPFQMLRSTWLSSWSVRILRLSCLLLCTEGPKVFYSTISSMFSHGFLSLIKTLSLEATLIVIWCTRTSRRFICDLTQYTSLNPTRLSAISDSWFDIVILNCHSKVVSYVKSDAPFIAGHDLLELV